MAKKSAKRAGRKATGASAFIRTGLEKDAKVEFKTLEASWTEAGNTAKLPHSLFYTIRSKMGIIGKRRRRKAVAVRKTGAAASRAPRTLSAPGSYLEIERMLDALVARSPDAQLTETLINARRHASLKVLKG